MTSIEAATVGIAALSLLISLYALWRQHRSEGRAHFTIEWESPGSLAYLNHGPGAARDVHVQLNGQIERAPQHIPYIGAGQAMRIEAMRSFGEVMGPLEIRWRDNRRRQQTLSLQLPDPPRSPRPPQSPRNADPLEKTVRAIAQSVLQEEFRDAVRQARRTPFRR